jgi:hypothetical protein
MLTVVDNQRLQLAADDKRPTPSSSAAVSVALPQRFAWAPAATA